MQTLVTFEVSESVRDTVDVEKAKADVACHVRKMAGPGRLTASGAFADGRGGFYVLDVTPVELVAEFLDAPILDICRIETHPLTSFEKAPAPFARWL